MALKPVTLIDPVDELQVVGFIDVPPAICGVGFTLTVIEALGPSQPVVVFTWLT